MQLDEITNLVCKTFEICGYFLAYLTATGLAGATGYLGFSIAEKILRRCSPDRMKMYEDVLELSQMMFVLSCTIGYLIVAVGLLFRHLVGGIYLVSGIPHEYEEIAVEMGIAFFGLLVILSMCLTMLLVIILVFAIGCKFKRLGRTAVVDEEAGLVKNGSCEDYGTSGALAHDVIIPPPVPHRENTFDDVHIIAPKKADEAWIRMNELSSVRDVSSRRESGFAAK